MTTPPLLTSAEQDDLFGNTISAVPNIDRRQLAAALRNVIVGMSLDEVVSIITNPYKELIEYLALSQGQQCGQKLSLLFNPHRLATHTTSSPKGLSVYQALQTPGFHDGLARATIFKKRDTPLSDLLYYVIQVGVNGVQYINEFPPHVARDFCLRYSLNDSSVVLDPCAGWGGRLAGCSVVCGEYVGYEPATRTAAGLRNLSDFVRKINPAFVGTIHCLPYEDSTEDAARYDFALTSPPYFNTEVYSDEDTQSCVRYPTFELWRDGFYLPLVDKTMRQLKPGAAFILNIGDRKWPLSDALYAHCNGRYKVRKLRTRLGGVAGLGRENGKGENFYEIRDDG